jgi:hypothetical protein
MLIRNYGLFWSREKVWWGSGGKGNAGSLLGKKKGAKRKEPVDFRDQRGVYVLYDETFRIMYIGQAGGRADQCLFQRLKQHRDDHLAERWKLFSWFGTRGVSGKGLTDKNELKPSLTDALNHIEAIMLAATEPPLNLQRGRFGSDVAQYLQYYEEVDDEE